MALVVQKGMICRHGPGSQALTSTSYLPLIEREQWPRQTTGLTQMHSIHPEQLTFITTFKLRD